MRWVRRSPGDQAVQVTTAKPKTEKDATWAAVGATVQRPRAAIDTATPVRPLHSATGLQFSAPDGTWQPCRCVAEHGVAVVGPLAGGPLFGAGDRVVQGPPQPFAPNQSLPLLPEQGHWVSPAPADAELVAQMGAEAEAPGLQWQPIFNDAAPWAARTEDGPGRQATYVSGTQELPHLVEWAARLLGLVAGLPDLRSVRIGTVGYIRTDQPRRQHLHRDLPLPAEGEAPGLF